MKPHQLESVDASEVTLGLSLQPLQVEDLGAEPHPALVHHVGS